MLVSLQFSWIFDGEGGGATLAKLNQTKKIRHCTPDSKPYQNVTDPQQFLNSWFTGKKMTRSLLYA